MADEQQRPLIGNPTATACPPCPPCRTSYGGGPTNLADLARRKLQESGTVGWLGKWAVIVLVVLYALPWLAARVFELATMFIVVTRRLRRGDDVVDIVLSAQALKKWLLEERRRARNYAESGGSSGAAQGHEAATEPRTDLQS